MEQLPRKYLSRAEMEKRIARFKELKGSDGGLPDSKMPGCERTLFNVIGFQPPHDIGENATSPVGDHAANAQKSVAATPNALRPPCRWPHRTTSCRVCASSSAASIGQFPNKSRLTINRMTSLVPSRI